MSTNNNTILKISIGSVISLILAAFVYLNSSKLDKSLWELDRDNRRIEIVEIKKELEDINLKIDLLLQQKMTALELKNKILEERNSL